MIFIELIMFVCIFILINMFSTNILRRILKTQWKELFKMTEASRTFIKLLTPVHLFVIKYKINKEIENSKKK